MIRKIGLALVFSATAAMADAPRVAVDIAPVHALVAQVMKGVGTPELIVPPGASPHGYALRPSQARSLSEADAVIWVGPGLTPWLEGPLDALAGEASQLVLMDVPQVLKLKIREGGGFLGHHHGDDEGDHADHEEHAGHDHEGHDHGDHEGHDHEGHDHEDHAQAPEAHASHVDHSLDPHAWLAPENAALWMLEISVVLGALDPDNAVAYETNARDGAAALAGLTAEINTILEPVRGQPFVVYHDAYQYFERSFDMPATGSLSGGDAQPAGAARVAEIRDMIADAGATCVMSEPQFNAGLVTAVGAAKTGVADPLGASLEPGPALYGDVLRGLATSLAECLQD
ncbi:zinc ABC transporter substrate-binding protein [Sulfitobacter sp. 20_GPM-1509m]|uniref:zinc ABC transporter substrate-binding protein n=1 Tax=Sulfitobacter sp. 20_GPM-1509m TaxID=1380367 RepID=UPI0004918EE1|nr:zinc ABC transporter substrate-binding protein [Sulfitobacter sp. 20_GPM-1509m]